jgi:hypothetical protein
MARSLALASLMIMAAALPAILPATGSAWAGSCDVDDYVTKAIGIEEPWLENAGYLFTQVTHNSAPQILTIAPEIEARFNDRLGMELDLPAFSAQEPVGRRPHAFGPMAVGLKGLGVQRCNPRGDRAMVLTGEIEGQYWADRRPSVLPGEGNSVTAQAMWAELWNPWFSEGEIGYTQRVGSGVSSGWFLNTSLGRAWSSAWAAQLELEINDQSTSTNGHRDIEVSVMPQVSYRPSPQWLLALGEQASVEQGAAQTGWSTWLMVERGFSDTDDPD